MANWTCRFIRHFQRVSLNVMSVHVFQCLRQPHPHPPYPLSKKVRGHSNFADTFSLSIRKSIDKCAVGLANLAKKVKEIFGGVFRGKIGDTKGLAQKGIGVPVVWFHGVHLRHLSGRHLPRRDLTTQHGLLHLYSHWTGDVRSSGIDVSPCTVRMSGFRTNFRTARPSDIVAIEFSAFAFNGILVTRTNITGVR